MPLHYKNEVLSAFNMNYDSTNGTRYYCCTPGTYNVKADCIFKCVSFTASTEDECKLAIFKNGSLWAIKTVVAINANDDSYNRIFNMYANDTLFLDAGDYVDIRIRTNIYVLGASYPITSAVGSFNVSFYSSDYINTNLPNSKWT